MEKPKIIMYGTEWCVDCHRSKAFLDNNGISYTYVDVDKNTSAMEFITDLNMGERIIPTIVFEDGTFLTEPTDVELARKIGVS